MDPDCYDKCRECQLSGGCHGFQARFMFVIVSPDFTRTFQSPHNCHLRCSLETFLIGIQCYKLSMFLLVHKFIGSSHITELRIRFPKETCVRKMRSSRTWNLTCLSQARTDYGGRQKSLHYFLCVYIILTNSVFVCSVGSHVSQTKWVINLSKLGSLWMPSQSCPRVTFLGPDPTWPGKTWTRPDPTRDCRQKVWPDPTRPDPRSDPSPICTFFN